MNDCSVLNPVYDGTHYRTGVPHCRNMSHPDTVSNRDPLFLVDDRSCVVNPERPPPARYAKKVVCPRANEVNNCRIIRPRNNGYRVAGSEGEIVPRMFFVCLRVVPIDPVSACSFPPIGSAQAVLDECVPLIIWHQRIFVNTCRHRDECVLPPVSFVERIHCWLGGCGIEACTCCGKERENKLSFHCCALSIFP